MDFNEFKEKTGKDAIECFKYANLAAAVAAADFCDLFTTLNNNDTMTIYKCVDGVAHLVALHIEKPEPNLVVLNALLKSENIDGEISFDNVGKSDKNKDEILDEICDAISDIKVHDMKITGIDVACYDSTRNQIFGNTDRVNTGIDAFMPTLKSMGICSSPKVRTAPHTISAEYFDEYSELAAVIASDRCCDYFVSVNNDKSVTIYKCVDGEAYPVVTQTPTIPEVGNYWVKMVGVLKYENGEVTFNSDRNNKGVSDEEEKATCDLVDGIVDDFTAMFEGKGTHIRASCIMINMFPWFMPNGHLLVSSEDMRDRLVNTRKWVNSKNSTFYRKVRKGMRELKLHKNMRRKRA